MISFLKNILINNLAKISLSSCSFCGAEEENVKLQKGPSVTICKDCASFAHKSFAVDINQVEHDACIFCSSVKSETNPMVGDDNKIVCSNCIEECAIQLLTEGYKFKNLTTIENSA